MNFLVNPKIMVLLYKSWCTFWLYYYL